jgi:hypothetical protein
MPFLHKYQEHNFENNFKTNNSILDTVPYKPEVIFIGTYNHGWSWNKSDFFYGRGMYMWTCLANLFLNNSNKLSRQRTEKNNIPSKSEIFQICENGKIVFADIVKGIKENISAIENPEKKYALVNNEYKWETYKDGPLDYMARNEWLEDNTAAIVDYLNQTKSIKHVYFTFKSGNWLVEKMNYIEQNVRENILFCSIFTPTANGFRKNLPFPFNERAWSLTHCWVWNNFENSIKINKEGYGHLNHEWLKQNGVDPNNF